MPKRLANEILDEVDKIENEDERVEYLIANQTLGIKEVLAYNFQTQWKFLLPEGPAPIERSENPPVGLEFSHLNFEMRKMYLFYEGGKPDLSQLKRETLWVTLLETLNEGEAKILDHMKDHTLTELYPNITQEVAYRAFPDMIPKPTPIKELLRDDKGRFIKKDKPKKKGSKK